MTSQINPNTIDGTYPIAGQDNSSQGFRNNFSNIATNLGYAASEITNLQQYSILVNQDNNLGGNTTITSGTFRGSRDSIYALGAVVGNITVNLQNSSYQTMTLGGSVSITFSNLSGASGQNLRFRLEIAVASTNYTVTLPAAVTVNISRIASAVGQTLYFQEAGTYVFEFSTNDGGTTIAIADLYRAPDQLQGNLTVVREINGTPQAGITMTVSNIAGQVYGAITANALSVQTLTYSSNSASFTGNVYADYFIANTGFVGNILTPVQTAITRVGTLTQLSVSGNANVGNLTVSGITDMCGGTVYGLQIIANAANNGSGQIYSNVGAVLVQPNAAITTYTITMPATPMSGQAIKVMFANTITTLNQTVVGGQTLYGALTTANANVGVEWIYISDFAAWFRSS